MTPCDTELSDRLNARLKIKINTVHKVTINAVQLRGENFLVSRYAHMPRTGSPLLSSGWLLFSFFSMVEARLGE